MFAFKGTTNTCSVQIDQIVDHFSEIRGKFDALSSSDINIPFFDLTSIPHVSQSSVLQELKHIKVKKAQPPGDIPSRILKDFAVHISKPIANIFNTSISQGTWPKVWKKEVVTPVAKVFPPAIMKNLRSISGLPTLDKILERLISDLIIPGMKKHIDISQYGNQKGISIQHYLINMINKVLTDTQTKSTEGTAVIALLID